MTARVLQQSRPNLDDLTRRNSTRVLMVDSFRSPAWLSRSADRRPACGGGVLAHAHRPADYRVCQQLLDIAVRFFQPYDGATGINPQVATRIHYQFWNEPDLACNWQEDTSAFLELYGQPRARRRRLPAGAGRHAGRASTGLRQRAAGDAGPPGRRQPGRLGLRCGRDRARDGVRELRHRTRLASAPHRPPVAQHTQRAHRTCRWPGPSPALGDASPRLRDRKHVPSTTRKGQHAAVREPEAGGPRRQSQPPRCVVR